MSSWWRSQPRGPEQSPPHLHSLTLTLINPLARTPALEPILTPSPAFTLPLALSPHCPPHPHLPGSHLVAPATRQPAAEAGAATRAHDAPARARGGRRGNTAPEEVVARGGGGDGSSRAGAGERRRRAWRRPLLRALAGGRYGQVRARGRGEPCRRDGRARQQAVGGCRVLSLRERVRRRATHRATARPRRYLPPHHHPRPHMRPHPQHTLSLAPIQITNTLALAFSFSCPLHSPSHFKFTHLLSAGTTTPWAQ